jgi:hypothetical protein
MGGRGWPARVEVIAGRRSRIRGSRREESRGRKPWKEIDFFLFCLFLIIILKMNLMKYFFNLSLLSHVNLTQLMKESRQFNWRDSRY